MFNYRKKEKGQAIVLIALAIVGLVAITALAIDASNAYSDRRHAQVAADNAALAGAMAVAKPPMNVYNEAHKITLDNHYGDDPGEDVTIIPPPGPFVDCKGTSIDPVNHSDPKDKLDYYVEVMIRSGVNTFFGPVIGINRLSSCVFSIARGEPTRWDSWAAGQAVAATSCHDKRAIDFSGASRVLIDGGGIYSNSDNGESLYVNDQDNLETLPDGTKPPLSAVGGFNIDGMTGTTVEDQWSCPWPQEMLPPPPAEMCNFTYDDFPPDTADSQISFETIGGKTVVDIQPGIYCISGTMGNPNMKGTDVSFVLLNKGLSWSSNTAYIHLSAPTDLSNPLNHILIYAPYGNTNTLKFNGTADMDIVGSVFAPDAQIVLQGDFTGSSLDSQWIGKTVYMTGSLIANIHFDDSTLHKYQVPPHVELTK